MQHPPFCAHDIIRLSRFGDGNKLPLTCLVPKFIISIHSGINGEGQVEEDLHGRNEASYVPNAGTLRG